MYLVQLEFSDGKLDFQNFTHRFIEIFCNTDGFTLLEF